MFASWERFRRYAAEEECELRNYELALSSTRVGRFIWSYAGF